MSKIQKAVELADKKRMRHQVKPHGTGNEGAFRTWTRIRRALKGDGLGTTLTWVREKRDQAHGKPWQPNFQLAVDALLEIHGGRTAEARAIMSDHRKCSPQTRG